MSAGIAFLRRFVDVQPMPGGDHHESLNFLEDVEVRGNKVAVARLPSLYLYVDWPRWLRPLVPLLNHFVLAAQVLAGLREGRYVVVREFRNGPFLAVAPLLWWFRRRLVLNINGNVPTSKSSVVSALGFKLLVAAGFRFMLFDGEIARPSLLARYPRLKLVAPLLCVPNRRPPAATPPHGEGAFILGLVGNFRAEKGGVESAWQLIDLLADIPGIRLSIGYRDKSLADKLPADRVIMRYTGDYGDYLDFIRSCDAMLIVADAEAYELRHSGVIIDSVAQSTLVLCPAYPIFASVVSRPNPVGLTYASLDGLPIAVQAAMCRARELRGNFADYYRARSVDQVGTALTRLC